MPPRKRAGDMTGILQQQLIQENAEELKKRQKEIAIMAEVEAEFSDIPIDYSDGPTPLVVEDDLLVEEVRLEEPYKVIITNTTLEQMTFGAGQHYTFEEGRKYRVPLQIAKHLASKGLLWDNSYR
jgi:hypothetical protein